MRPFESGGAACARSGASTSRPLLSRSGAVGALVRRVNRGVNRLGRNGASAVFM